LAEAPYHRPDHLLRFLPCLDELVSPKALAKRCGVVYSFDKESG